jgi:hypothetical protein
MQRTQARVDNELVYTRQTFLATIEEATEIDLGVSDIVVECGTVDGVKLTLNLPHVGAARGKFYIISGTVDDAIGGGEVEINGSGTAVQITHDADGAFVNMLYSTGLTWLEVTLT